MSINTQAISGSADQLLGMGDSLGQEVESFRSQAEAVTGAFGGDTLGSALGMIYQIVSEAAFESFADNAEGLGEIGQNLQNMAADYTTVDNDNSDMFRDIQGGLS
ncbi:hypothetical protein [Umezawaea sp. Da 62-37]|uniref:WXG100 family type VII secretion target n=1 Tax=Umezawaea sp. Da 62-37 TaxID=3075927 RepID=UPI0028F72D02|nr:hypothetical protein [Umezawaea sp. Da 62-37]WNV87849.1 hypothetical protein RM788_06075 [Umezawaea sp. Da 62-37]